MNVKTVFENRGAVLFFTIAVIFAVFIAGTAVSVSVMTQNAYEKGYVQREEQVAGRLVRDHPQISANEIAQDFTAPLTHDDIVSGKNALASEGYSLSTAGYLFEFVPPITRMSAGIFAFSGMISLLFCAFAAFLVLKNLYKGINAATEAAHTFSRGDYSARIPENCEGAQARLAHAFNETAGSVKSGFERLAHQREYLKQLLSDISHQLRTPLCALRMYNEIIAQEKISAPAREFNEKSAGQLDRMEWLANGLLKTARIEAGMLEFDMQPHDLLDIAGRCVENFKDQALNKGITLKASGVSVKLKCDEEWLTEAVGNIIKNCLLYVPQGGRITVSTESTPVSANIIIEDTGEGIHPDDMPFIFKRFFRGRNAKGDGSGIGLNLSQSIARQMGGTLSVKSIYGHGASFAFTFLYGAV